MGLWEYLRACHRSLPAYKDASTERRIEGKETVQWVAGRTIEGTNVGAAAWAGAGHDIGMAISVGIDRRNTGAAAEGRIISKEIEESSWQRITQYLSPVEHLHFRPAAPTWPGDDIRRAIMIGIAGRHKHAS